MSGRVLSDDDLLRILNNKKVNSFELDAIFNDPFDDLDFVFIDKKDTEE